MSRTKIQDIGESIACDYLLRQGHKIIDRNYRSAAIVSEQEGKYHFIQVETVNANGKPKVRGMKMIKMASTIQAWIFEKKAWEVGWTVDVIAVKLNMPKRLATVEIIKDIVL
jgi:Holliday junction resolvase-like predicted endonuclease